MGWRDLKEEKPVEPEKQETEELEPPPGMEDVEQGFQEDIDEALAAFKKRREKENSRFADVTDCGYYFTVCFTSRAQMDEFCDRFGLDKDLKYHDGKELAKQLNRALRTPDPAIPREKGHTADYTERARQ